PWDEPSLAQDLEAVTDAEDEAAVGGKPRDRLHHGREPGDRTAAKVVAVREAAREDDGTDVGKFGLRVPDAHGLGAERLERQLCVPVVLRSGEDHDRDSWRVAGAHRASPSAIS